MIAVRDESNSAESFALELAGTDDIYIAFFSESAMRGYVAGEPYEAEDVIEHFDVTTAIPPLSAEMFEIETDRLSGSISMLDIFNDQIVTVTINVTC